MSGVEQQGMAMEEVRLRLSVVAPLSMGFASATLVFTDSRMIVAYLGKKSSRFLLGTVGKLLTGLLKGGSEEEKRRLIKSSPPEQLLTYDPFNFAIKYDEMVKAELTFHNIQGIAELVVITRQEKLVFRLVSGSSPKNLEEELGRVLGDRLSVRTVTRYGQLS